MRYFGSLLPWGEGQDEGRFPYAMRRSVGAHGHSRGRRITATGVPFEAGQSAEPETARFVPASFKDSTAVDLVARPVFEGRGGAGCSRFSRLRSARLPLAPPSSGFLFPGLAFGGSTQASSGVARSRTTSGGSVSATRARSFPRCCSSRGSPGAPPSTGSPRR